MLAVGTCAGSKIFCYVTFSILLSCSFGIAHDEDTVQLDFEHLGTTEFSRRTQLLAALRRAITEPGGVAYFRTMATGLQVGGAVEGINLQAHMRNFARILEAVPPSQIHWNNVALLWGSYFPDNSDVGTIRQLAIDLQDWDRNGRENYADLRQEVHNRPTSATVERLRLEMERVRAIVDNFTGSDGDLERERVRLQTLTELYELEKKFWGGSGIEGNEIRNFVALYQAERAYRSFIPKASDSPQEKVRKITKLREKMRRELGIDGVSMEALMSSEKPLSASQAQALTTYLSFDRRMATEAQRQLAMLSPADIRKKPGENLRLLSDMMALDNFISRGRHQELHHLSKNIADQAARIRTLLGEPIGRLQQGFGALQTRLEQLNRSESMDDSVQGARQPEELIYQTDNEVRSSLLFDVGHVGQVILRSHSDPVETNIEGKRDKSTDSEIVLPIRRPISGKVFVIRSEADVRTAVEYASSGVPLILVKLTHLDIDPPPAELLITRDPTLNQASHMAMRAKDAGMGHVNFINKDSALLKWLLAQEGEQIQIRTDPENANLLHVDKGGKSSNAQDKLTIDTLIDEKYAQPVLLTRLLRTESAHCDKGTCLSGGKGRGLAVILAELEKQKRTDNPYKIPEGVQVPYGLFREWFQSIQVLGDWEEALREGPNSIKWDRLMRDLKDKPVPAPILERIVKQLGGSKGLGQGWFVRSNSNSEDGGFNGAGINLTVPDVNNESDLRAALAKVFLATYGPNARAWWARMFKNPEAVRSQVLLMKTIAATHSSVAVISKDGTRMTIESLPGVGSNVVDGKGVAERLSFEINPQTGEVKQLVVVTPAMSSSLKVWEGQGASRKVSEKSRVYYGRVLSEEQQKAFAKVAHDLRKTADRTIEFKGKPLDIEIAWTGGAPHLVQIRRAPAEPEKVKASSWKAKKTKQTAHMPAKYGFSFKVLVKSILEDLKQDTGKISDATQLKIATLTNQVQQAGQGGESQVQQIFHTLGGEQIVERLRARGAQLLLEVSQGTELPERALIEARNLASLFEMLPVSRNNSGRESFFPPEKREDLTKQLINFFEHHYGPMDAKAFLNSITALYPHRMEDIYVKVFKSLSTQRMKQVVADTVKNQQLRNLVSDGEKVEGDRLTQILRTGEKSAAIQAHKRLRALLEVNESIHDDLYQHHGRPTTYYVTDKLLAELKRTHSGIAFQNLYDRTLAAFLKRVGMPNVDHTWDLGLDDDDKSKKLEKWLRDSFEDFNLVRRLAQFRQQYHRQVLEKELKKKPADRNWDDISSVLNDKDDRSSTHGKQVLQSAKKLLSEAQISITPFVNRGIEVRFCTETAICRMSFLTDKNLGDLLWAKNIKIDADVPHVKAKDDEHPGEARRIDLKTLPSPKEIAKSPAKIFLLLTHLAAYRQPDGHFGEVRSLLQKVLEERAKINLPMRVEEWFAIFQRNSLLRMIHKNGLSDKLDKILKDQLPGSLKKVTVITETIHGKERTQYGLDKDIQLKLVDPKSRKIVATIELSGGRDHNEKWKLAIDIGGVSIEGGEAYTQEELFAKAGVGSLLGMLENTFKVDLMTSLGRGTIDFCDDFFGGAPQRTPPVDLPGA